MRTGDGTIQHAEWQSRGYRIHASVHEPVDTPGVWVVYSHGFTSQRLGPEYLLVGLGRHLAAQGVGSVRFDFAGAGESEGRFDEMTVSTMVADLLRACTWVRERYAPSRLVLLGHSLGGCVAALAADEADADGLVLLASVAHPLDIARNYKGIIAEEANAEGYYEVGAHEMSLAFLRDLEGADPLAALTRARCPRALVLHGSDDQSVPLSESKSYVEAMRKADRDVRLEIVDGANHRILSVQGRKRVNHLVTQWLERHFS